jgi:hypothetical protein
MYKMFLDDIRNPPDNTWIVARSSNEAVAYIEKHGLPYHISFDHDLGGDDTAMVLLYHLVNNIYTAADYPPEYTVHSANPIGSKNIVSFMESWKRSLC